MRTFTYLSVFWRLLPLLALTQVIVTFGHAQSQPCDFSVNSLGNPTLRCRLHQVNALVAGLDSTSSNVPRKFNFQARLSQAKLLLGNQTIDRITFAIYNLKDQLLCSMEKSNVVITKSVLNLEIIQEELGGCNLADTIATHNQVKVKVCLGNQNCLRPIKLSTVPYAFKSEYAYWALKAANTEQSSISHYTEKITADRDLLNSQRNALSQNITGEFLVKTSEVQHVPNQANESVVLSSRADAGTLLWKTYNNSQAKFFIASKDQHRDKLRRLNRLSWLSERSHVLGNLLIDGLESEQVRAGFQIVDGALFLRNPLRIREDLNIAGAHLNSNHLLSYDPQLATATNSYEGSAFGLNIQTVSGNNTNRLLEIKGNTQVEGTLHIGQSARISGSATVSGANVIEGRVSINQGLTIEGVQNQANDALVVNALESTDDPSNSSPPRIEMTTLSVGPHLSEASPLQITSGDLHISGSNGVDIQGNGLFNEGVTLNRVESGFATNSLVLQMRQHVNQVDGAAELRSKVISSEGIRLQLGESGNKLVVRGRTRLIGNVNFQSTVRRGGGCRISIPADQQGKPIDDVDRFSLICGSTDVLLRPFRCGNGKIDQGEQCDQGDLIDGDGCSSHCLCEPENLIDGIFFTPRENDEVLRPCAGDLCGNDRVDLGEECDDGTPEVVDQAALQVGDTCEQCLIRACGNGIVSFNSAGVAEECDDGNTRDGDGCDRFCRIEDLDRDGVNNTNDNCINVANANQTNTDNDNQGDACDNDDDNDGVNDINDACSLGFIVINGQAWNSDPASDFDGDGCRDIDQDEDDDNDQVLDINDSNSTNPNLCSDNDTDLCDDCSSGRFDVANDGPDFDGDGLCDLGDPDDDDDGSLDVDDTDDNNPNICSDTDFDQCDDCINGTFDPANDGADFEGDGLCDLGDPDDDNDGSLDVDDTDPLDPNVCSDTDLDTCEDCLNGTYNPADDGPDFDGDGLCDAGDNDQDNDGVLAANDSDDRHRFACSDLDTDGCDDCSSGSFDLANDGSDFDGDGSCDLGDSDDDNDGSLDVDDTDDNNPNICSDNDGDNCDDCSNGSYNIADDGFDFDGDGLCDLGDSDDDNDGVLDQNDSNDNNVNVCSDTDFDTCDDCLNGSFAPNNDGPDFDGDGLCDVGDQDDDNDGSLDIDDTNDNNPNICSDTDFDTCDDCVSGTFDPTNDGNDFDGDGLCDVGDSDDDNDGSLDIDDTDDNNPNVCSDTDLDSCDDCTFGSYDPLNDGNDTDSDGVCDLSDVCIDVADPDQADRDNDNEGDACDCGDNFVVAGEECDDGNTVNGDGCNSLCVIE